MGLTGFDWLLIDIEHCPIGLGDLRALIPVLEATQTSSVVRVPDRGDYWIKQALDIGADAVMVPRVDSAEIARQAVRYAKYYPLGERGFGPVRATKFGHSPDYVSTANEDRLLFAQLEHRIALENIDEILEVEGIDGFFIGPGDLSQSLGLLGQPNAPKEKETERKIIEKLNRQGRPWGTVSGDAEAFRYYVELGQRLASLGGDLSFVSQGAKNCLGEMQQIVKQLSTR